MKIRKLVAIVTEKVAVSRYENISPTSGVVEAELEEGDDPEKCMAELQQFASRQWAKQVLRELAWIRDRKKDDKDKLHEFTVTTDGLKKQLVNLIKGNK